MRALCNRIKCQRVCLLTTSSKCLGRRRPCLTSRGVVNQNCSLLCSAEYIRSRWCWSHFSVRLMGSGKKHSLVLLNCLCLCWHFQRMGLKECTCCPTGRCWSQRLVFLNIRRAVQEQQLIFCCVTDSQTWSRFKGEVCGVLKKLWTLWQKKTTRKSGNRTWWSHVSLDTAAIARNLLEMFQKFGNQFTSIFSGC